MRSCIYYNNRDISLSYANESRRKKIDYVVNYVASQKKKPKDFRFRFKKGEINLSVNTNNNLFVYLLNFEM